MSNDAIQKLIRSAGLLPEHEIQLLTEALVKRSFAKDETLLDQGEVCRCWWFIIEGATFQYKLDDELEYNIIDLSITHDWVVNHKSFTSQDPSSYTIKAFEDTVVYELNIHEIHRLIGASQAFLQMGKILDGATSRVTFFDNNSTPDEKYTYLMQNRRGLIQSFPQKMIASYLKITPETLSRVRARLS